jgi:lysozyme family protein
LIQQRRFAEAENLAVDFIAEDTDRGAAWTSVPAIEFYVRDCIFNRGGTGGAGILQRTLGAIDDGAIGQETRNAEKAAEDDAAGLLIRLRSARERYERDVVHRNTASKFWKGLANRWDKAVIVAKGFPMTPAIESPSLSPPSPGLAPNSFSFTSPDALPTVTLPALRIGVSGPRVATWQSFLKGRGFDPGTIDGSFGERTRKASKAFQQETKITADGVVGRETLLKAASLGLELIEEPTDDRTSSNFRPGQALHR